MCLYIYLHVHIHLHLCLYVCVRQLYYPAPTSPATEQGQNQNMSACQRSVGFVQKVRCVAERWLDPAKDGVNLIQRTPTAEIQLLRFQVEVDQIMRTNWIHLSRTSLQTAHNEQFKSFPGLLLLGHCIEFEVRNNKSCKELLSPQFLRSLQRSLVQTRTLFETACKTHLAALCVTVLIGKPY